MYTVVIIEFGQAIYTVDEGNEFVGLNITKSGETQEDFIVQVILLDRTAVGKSHKCDDLAR